MGIVSRKKRRAIEKSTRESCLYAADADATADKKSACRLPKTTEQTRVSLSYHMILPINPRSGLELR